MEPKPQPGELTVKLLWDLANALSPENHTKRLLRSHYLTAAKKIGRRDVKLPAVKFAPSVMCPKCSSIWSESNFSLKLKSQRIHTAKARKLVDTLNSDPKSLTRKQRTRAKWLKKAITSHMEIKCEFCQKKTMQPLIKPKKTKAEEAEPEPVEEIPIKNKKKKKAKDKTAGLNLEKVTPKETKPCVPPKKAKKSKVPPQKAKVEKAISKTQKQNSLLQLANMLKNRTPVGSSNSNNQLEKLLR